MFVLSETRSAVLQVRAVPSGLPRRWHEVRARRLHAEATAVLPGGLRQRSVDEGAV
jgi:hypothetical protein